MVFGTFMILIDFLETVISTVEYVQDESLGTIFNFDKSTSEESTSYSFATPENLGLFLLSASFFNTNLIQYCMVCSHSLFLFISDILDGPLSNRYFSY